MIDFRFAPAIAVLLLATGCNNPAADAVDAKVAAAEPVNEDAAGASDDTAKTEKLPLTSETTTIEFVGSKVTGSHEGGFKKFDGTFHLVSADLAQCRLNAEIDMDSTWSDSEKLTGHLKSADFFDVKKYPTAKFVSTKIEPATGKKASHTITGNLTLHGVTKSIAFPATLKITDQAASLESEFAINRKDFKIVYPGQPDNLIRDEVVIRLKINAPRGESEDTASDAPVSEA